MNKTGQAEVGLLQPRPCPRPLPQAPPGMLTANTSELQTGRVRASSPPPPLPSPHHSCPDNTPAAVLF